MIITTAIMFSINVLAAVMLFDNIMKSKFTMTFFILNVAFGLINFWKLAIAVLVP